MLDLTNVKPILLKSASFLLLSVYLILVLAGSFSSLMHRVSHDLQSALSGLEHVENHQHNHLHSNSDHTHHVDHAHPLIDFLKELSDQTEAPINTTDFKIPHLSFHEKPDGKAVVLPITNSQNVHVPYLAVLLNGYSGLSTPPPQV